MRLPPAAFDNALRTVIPGDDDYPGIVNVIVPKVGCDSGVDFYGLWVAQQIPYGIDGMNAHIGQGTATRQFLFGKPSRWPPILVDAIALGFENLSEFPRSDSFFYIIHIRIEAPHMTDHDRSIVSLGNFFDLLPFRSIHSHWFFNKNVFPAF